MTSATMVGGGAVLVIVGLAVGAGHMARVTRQWVREMDVPPSEVARVKWDQARSAVSAGAAAWQNGATPASSS